MAFKLIPKGEIRAARKIPPHVTITPNAVFCISTAAVELLTREHNYEYAFLFWDEEKKLIAIRPTRRKDDRAYRITYSSSGRDAHLSGKSFCEIIRYDYRRRRSFLAQWNEAGREFLIDLKAEMLKAVKGVRGPQPVASDDEISETELATWYTKTEVCARLRLSKRSLERIAQEGRFEKRYRRVAGRMSEPVYNPKDIDAALERKTTKTG